MIFTSLAPNTQADDVRLALGLLLRPWVWQSGNHTLEFERTLTQYLGNESRVFLFESGRTALAMLLQSLAPDNKDEVLLQAYTCVAVPDPIIWNGLTPIYVDIDDTLTMDPHDLEKKITPSSKAIIVQHTFGYASRLDEILAIAKRHNLFVIEDCAHALGSQYHNKPLGTFADASFFSFGRDKSLSAVFGGALSVKNPDLAHRIDMRYKSYSYPTHTWILQQLMHPIIVPLAKKLYKIRLGPALIEVSKRLGIISRAVYAQEKEGERPHFIFKRLPNALARLALNQFKKLERFTEHRKTIAKIYTDSLQPTRYKLQAIAPDSSPAPLRFTIRTPDALAAAREARQKGILLGDWYRTVLAPAGSSYEKLGYAPQSCPRAEQASEESLNLPTDIHISPQDAKFVVNSIRDALSQTNQ